MSNHMKAWLKTIGTFALLILGGTLYYIITEQKATGDDVITVAIIIIVINLLQDKYLKDIENKEK